MKKHNNYQNRQARNCNKCRPQPEGIEGIIGPVISEIGMTTVGVDIDETVRIPLSEYKALILDAAQLATVKQLISLDANETYVSSDHVRAAIGILRAPEEAAKE